MPYAPQLPQSAHPDWSIAQGKSQYYPLFLWQHQDYYEAFRRDISWLEPFCRNIVEDLITRGYTCRLDDNDFASSSSSSSVAQTHSSSRSPHPSTSSPSSYENFQVSGPPDLFMSGPPTLDWLPTSHPSTPTHQPNKTSSVSQYGQSLHNTASSASPRTDISDITSFLSDSSPHASSTYNDSYSQPTRGRSVYPASRATTSLPPQASSSSHQNDFSPALHLPHDLNRDRRPSAQLFAAYYGTTQVPDSQPHHFSPQPLYGAAPQPQDHESDRDFTGFSTLGWISPSTPSQPESFAPLAPSPMVRTVSQVSTSPQHWILNLLYYKDKKNESSAFIAEYFTTWYM
ncbi:hypothetical protein CPB85DRAFT_1436069 [Mucidula mucida]|nr:hypothetical protein CPB85DRAFT_1436069 [Mucidula mucida]